MTDRIEDLFDERDRLRKKHPWDRPGDGLRSFFVAAESLLDSNPEHALAVVCLMLETQKVALRREIMRLAEHGDDREGRRETTANIPGNDAS